MQQARLQQTTKFGHPQPTANRAERLGSGKVPDLVDEVRYVPACTRVSHKGKKAAMQRVSVRIDGKGSSMFNSLAAMPDATTAALCLFRKTRHEELTLEPENAAPRRLELELHVQGGDSPWSDFCLLQLSATCCKPASR
jgi:hypothetical protein